MTVQKILMPFGKYKGMPIENVPDSYIAWLFKCNILKEGNLRNSIRRVVIDKNKEAWLNKCFDEWIYDNYVPKSFSSYNSIDASSYYIDEYLEDAMCGCLPNQ